MFLSITESRVWKFPNIKVELSVSPLDCQFLLRVFQWSTIECVTIYTYCIILHWIFPKYMSFVVFLDLKSLLFGMIYSYSCVLFVTICLKYLYLPFNLCFVDSIQLLLSSWIVPHSLWILPSVTRDWTHALSSETAES